jgi:hypothetical protein
LKKLSFKGEMGMNKIQQKRWEAAKKFWNRVKVKAEKHNAVIEFDEELMVNHTDLEIGDNYIRLGKQLCVFEADTEYDHGLYQTTKEYKEDMLSRIRLLAVIKI